MALLLMGNGSEMDVWQLKARPESKRWQVMAGCWVVGCGLVPHPIIHFQLTRGTADETAAWSKFLESLKGPFEIAFQIGVFRREEDVIIDSHFVMPDRLRSRSDILPVSIKFALYHGTSTNSIFVVGKQASRA